MLAFMAPLLWFPRLQQHVRFFCRNQPCRHYARFHGPASLLSSPSTAYPLILSYFLFAYIHRHIALAGALRATVGYGCAPQVTDPALSRWPTDIVRKPRRPQSRSSDVSGPERAVGPVSAVKSRFRGKNPHAFHVPLDGRTTVKRSFGFSPSERC